MSLKTKRPSRPVISAEFHYYVSPPRGSNYRWQVILVCGCDVEMTAKNVSLKFDGMKRFVAPKTGRCPGHCCALGDE